MDRIFSLVKGILLVLAVIALMTMAGTCVAIFRQQSPEVAADSVMLLKLEGVILDGSQFLKQLRKYIDEPEIKAVVIQINSPGGVVGPSQEIHAEILRIRKELKKPVVVTCGGLAASGAFYAAVAGKPVFVNPGTMMGSIGVIMEFANLEGLYSWAKVKRYSITTGPYKDSGAEYRSMRDDERALFQSLISEVHMQFKQAVATSRGLELDKVTPYADGRVFTGATAIKLGFADKIGGLTEAIKEAAKQAGIKGTPEVFEPPKGQKWNLDMLVGDSKSALEPLQHISRQVLPTEIFGKPLYLLPGAF